MQTTPAASATPDGTVRVARRFRWIPDHELRLIERAERRHLESLIDRVEAFDEAEWRWQNQLQRLRNAADAGLEPDELFVRKLSLRRAARMEHIELRREARRLAESARRANGCLGRRH